MCLPLFQPSRPDAGQPPFDEYPWAYYNVIPNALLANTNLGGENAHRGAVLGGIVSLSCDSTVDAWFGQLVDYRAIQAEIAAWLSPF